MKRIIKVRELQPGDYVIAARATVLTIDAFASVVIVDFTDKTSTAPIPGNAPVEIERTAKCQPIN